MRPRIVQSAFILAIVASAFIGCEQPPPKERTWEAPRQPISEAPKHYDKPLPPGQLALRKIPESEYPDFRAAFNDWDGLEDAMRASADYLERPSSQRYYPYGDISHARVRATLEAFRDVMYRARNADEFNQLIRQNFDVYQSVGWDQQGSVWFTGYYCPIFEGRLQPDAQFRYPLYKLPPDLVKDAEGRVRGRRRPDGSLVPYFTRAEIETQGHCDGLEIAWLKDPFEAYIVSVQGSGKLRLADGAILELGYAGNNGHEYFSVARQMVRDGVIDRSQLNLDAMRAYFRAHPEAVQRYLHLNPRFIFFHREVGGPYGNLNVVVTPNRTIATDKSVFPRAALAFLKTQLPLPTSSAQSTQKPITRFVLDQDTGGAIRAAGRADVYFGVGAQAEALAGRTGAEGALYYLFVKQHAVARNE